MAMTWEVPDSLTQLAQETHEALELIWQRIGLASHEKTQQKALLVQQIRQVYEDTKQHFREVETALQQEIEALRSEIQEIGHVLNDNLTQGALQKSTSMGGNSLRETIDLLRLERDDLNRIRKDRADQLETLKSELDQLALRLEEEVEPQFEDITVDLNAKRIEEFQNAIQIKRGEVENRSRAISIVVGECAELLAELKLDEELSEFDQLLRGRSQNMSLGLDTIERVSSRARELQDIKRERELLLKELGGQISLLWEQLEVPQETQDQFFREVTGVGTDAIDACKMELNRLIQLKRERVGELIEKVRQQINEKWDEMEYTPESREYCSIMRAPPSEFTEELLAEHENERDHLEIRLTAMKPLLKYISMREAIIEERREFEESLKDPNRLTSRTVDTKRLLREEKLQARIKKDLPKLTKLLEERIPVWEEQNKSVFLFKGEPYLEAMRAADRQYIEQKAQEKTEKERAKREKIQQEVWGSPASATSSTPGPKEKGRSKFLKTRASLGSIGNQTPPKRESSKNPLDNFCSFSRDSSTHSLRSFSSGSSRDDNQDSH